MLRFFKTFYLPLIAGILLSLSRVPLYLGWLVFVAFVPLLYYFKQGKHTLKQNLISAMLFCLVQILVVFNWIGLVTLLGLVGIWLIFSVYYLITFLVIEQVWRKSQALAYPIFVTAIISFEYLQNFGEMRFPWWNIGYSLADYTTLLQALDLGGLSLLALLVLSINYLVYQLTLGKRRAIFPIVVCCIAWYAYGQYRLLTLPLEKQSQRISVMQPSIEQDEKWDIEKYREIIEVYRELSAQASKNGTQLHIYPEAAIPDYLMYSEQAHTDLTSIIDANQMSIFTGFPHVEQAPPEHPQSHYYYNAAALFHPYRHEPKLFYKNILVPVGERMLWLDHFPFLWKLQFGQANWEFGTTIPRYEYDGMEFTPSICYELAFPHFMQRANFNSRKADFHVNITNDAWFGTSYGPWLHGMMSKFRAIESRIQIYRSANTGISMIVNPKGEIISSASLFERTNINAELYTCADTPLYHRIYPYPWIFVCLTAVLTIYSFIIPRRGL
ncbi:MAG: apolipoprotein N-acyltransferase [Candidatus Cloacimonetes bacterium]|jgi:apolipoprotein N-acyltransferase|nr:apolipoprotein N-acyltransferase [Candidatus Cloacimonadota bacterium]MDD2507310.1 apolipoprotein N-acyltransferase [Candidatus Cloacimonadota bacterium]MDD4147396.1 apolipoprotein N-acyltransferase [Candidatus Cloacimonadota bacterium]MDD4559334.1 apolipoprotein N-acyltransferase [Candidatus Cloacimonadota bacterium]